MLLVLQPEAFPLPSSRPTFYIRSACTAHAVAEKIDAHFARYPLLGAEEACNPFQGEIKEAEAVPNEKERVETPSRDSENEAQESDDERQAKVPASATQGCR